MTRTESDGLRSSRPVSCTKARTPIMRKMQASKYPPRWCHTTSSMDGFITRNSRAAPNANLDDRMVRRSLNRHEDHESMENDVGSIPPGVVIRKEPVRKSEPDEQQWTIQRIVAFPVSTRGRVVAVAEAFEQRTPAVQLREIPN